ncbi:hypothetical protein BDZ89DRAFT_1144143 [Hymenopellis radicata]|nr:hypothetical protein BDZ89DRAFT_1144143 [Hymenopellis radicata]
MARTQDELAAYLIDVAASSPLSVCSIIVYVAAVINMVILAVWPGNVLSETRRQLDETRNWLEEHSRQRANGSIHRICASGHYALDEIHDRVHDLESLHHRTTGVFKYIRKNPTSKFLQKCFSELLRGSGSQVNVDKAKEEVNRNANRSSPFQTPDRTDAQNEPWPNTVGHTFPSLHDLPDAFNHCVRQAPSFLRQCLRVAAALATCNTGNLQEAHFSPAGTASPPTNSTARGLEHGFVNLFICSTTLAATRRRLLVGPRRNRYGCQERGTGVSEIVAHSTRTIGFTSYQQTASITHPLYSASKKATAESEPEKKKAAFVRPASKAASVKPASRAASVKPSFKASNKPASRAASAKPASRAASKKPAQRARNHRPRSVLHPYLPVLSIHAYTAIRRVRVAEPAAAPTPVEETIAKEPEEEAEAEAAAAEG